MLHALLVVALMGAPIPPVRSSTTHELKGDYRLEWVGSSYLVSFEPRGKRYWWSYLDGSYRTYGERRRDGSAMIFEDYRLEENEPGVWEKKPGARWSIYFLPGGLTGHHQEVLVGEKCAPTVKLIPLEAPR